jgi:hypothetical protein
MRFLSADITRFTAAMGLILSLAVVLATLAK